MFKSLNLYMYYSIISYFFSGTGSYPHLQKGLQRNILKIAIAEPLKAPNLSTAVIAYDEQVGVNLHLGRVLTDIFF